MLHSPIPRLCPVHLHTSPHIKHHLPDLSNMYILEYVQALLQVPPQQTPATPPPTHPAPQPTQRPSPKPTARKAAPEKPPPLRRALVRTTAPDFENRIQRQTPAWTSSRPEPTPFWTSPPRHHDHPNRQFHLRYPLHSPLTHLHLSLATHVLKTTPPTAPPTRPHRRPAQSLTTTILAIPTTTFSPMIQNPLQNTFASPTSPTSDNLYLDNALRLTIPKTAALHPNIVADPDRIKCASELPADYTVPSKASMTHAEKTASTKTLWTQCSINSHSHTPRPPNKPSTSGLTARWVTNIAKCYAKADRLDVELAKTHPRLLRRGFELVDHHNPYRPTGKTGLPQRR